MFRPTSILWPWGFLFTFGSFVISVVLGIFRARKRVEDMAAEARALGLTYKPWTGLDPAQALSFNTALFQGGRGFGFKNIVTGNYAGMEVQIFDFTRTSGNTTNSTSTVQTVAVYKQNVDLPVFAIGPGGLAAKIIDALEHQNVDLKSPTFSRHYAVSGPDKDRIRALFNERLISFLESLDHGKQWHIEGAGKTLVIYRYARRVKPTALKDFLQDTSSIAQSFFNFAGVSEQSQFHSAAAE
jgi:hypothetical protein